MPGSRTRFYLDPQDAKYKGVCAGIADYTGFDVTLIRVALVVLTFATSGWLILAYIAAAWLAPTRPTDLYAGPEDAKFWQGVRTTPRRSAGEVRATLQEHGAAVSLSGLSRFFRRHSISRKTRRSTRPNRTART